MTNILNRLKILILEEIVISEMNNIIELIRILKEIEASNKWDQN